ncbi:NAD-binding protein [Saccharothrix texasensis]|uniref:NAD-binding protein n=1 Tax=Saccharothrix texasensis TaxID=103734 RepID=UPI003CCC7BDE
MEGGPRSRAVLVIGYSRTGAAATDAAVLRRAGVSQARCVVVSCTGDATTAMVVTLVRRAGPRPGSWSRCVNRSTCRRCGRPERTWWCPPSGSGRTWRP